LSEEQEKPSDLVAVTDPLEIIKFFDEGAKTNANMLVWTKEDETSAKCHIVSLSQTERMIYTTAPNTPDTSKLFENLKAAGDKCFLNMKLERATIFFTSRLNSSSYANSQFTLPTKLFKVQRRQKQRFKILQGYVLKVSFSTEEDLKKILTHKIYDISSGGLSFFSDGATTPYRKGQKLMNMTFTVRTHNFNLIGDIIHCEPVTDGTKDAAPTKFNIGVKFQEVTKEDEAIIDNYIFEENRKLISRFL
jgi:c-di-GMP-binding flagellar brake protein YcgR